MSKAKPTTERTEEQTLKFTTEYGVAMDYTDSNRGSILPKKDWNGSVDVLDMNQGGIVNPANTVALYWDYEKYGAPYANLPNDIIEPVVTIEETEHMDVPAFRLKTEDGASEALMTQQYIEQAGEVFGIDVVENPERIRLHPDKDNYPAVIPDPIPESETFVVVAPRMD